MEHRQLGVSSTATDGLGLVSALIDGVRACAVTDTRARSCCALLQIAPQIGVWATLPPWTGAAHDLVDLHRSSFHCPLDGPAPRSTSFSFALASKQPLHRGSARGAGDVRVLIDHPHRVRVALKLCARCARVVRFPLWMLYQVSQFIVPPLDATATYGRH